MRLVSSLGKFAKRHSLAVSLLGVVAASSVIIPACDPNKDPLPTTLAFRPNTPTEVRAGQTVTVTAVLLDQDQDEVSISAGDGAITYSIAPAEQAYATVNATTGVVTAATVMNEAQRTITVTASATPPGGYMAPTAATTRLTVLSRVSSVTLSPGAITMRVGDAPRAVTASNIIVSGSPSSPAPVYTYTSSNPLQASVDAQGQVRAVSATPAGAPVTITATAEGISSNNVLVTVQPPLVTTIVVTPKTATVQVGRTFTFDAPISNPGPGTPLVVWSSADQNRVSINQQGVVTGNAPTLAGTPVRITASYTTGTTTVTDFADVTVVPIPPSIVITTKPPRLMLTGETQQLAATVSNPGAGQVTVLWASLDATRLTVSPSGLVTAVAPTLPNTPVRITATYSSGGTTVSDFVDITANPAPVVTVSPKTLSVAINEKKPLAAGIANPVTGVSVVWESADNSKVTVNAATGEVTGVSVTPGTSTVRVTAKYTTGGITYSDFADVSVTAATIGLRVTPVDVPPVAVGTQVVVTAEITNPVAGITLQWVVRPAGIANNVSQSGSSMTVQGVAPGVTYAVATVTNGTTVLRDSTKITVIAAPSTGSRIARIAIEPLNAQVTAPAGLNYRVMFFDAAGARTTVETGGTLQFTSTPTSGTTPVATIDASTGRATGVREGQTTIMARYLLNGQSVTTDQTPLIVYPVGTAGHFGSMEISTAGNARNVTVGGELIFQVIVRDVNGNQVTSGVSGLTVTSSSPAITITTESGFGPGYFYRMRGVTATTPGTGTNPLGGAVRISADGPGVHAEILVTVGN